MRSHPKYILSVLLIFLYSLMAFTSEPDSLLNILNSGKGDDQISKDDVNNMIWAVDGGIGLDILFLFIEANYEYSFNDYFTEATVGSGKHGAFIINAGVHIDF